MRHRRSDGARSFGSTGGATETRHWIGQAVRVVDPPRATGTPFVLVMPDQGPLTDHRPMTRGSRYLLVYRVGRRGRFGLEADLGPDEVWPDFALLTERSNLPPDRLVLHKAMRVAFEGAVAHPGSNAQAFLDFLPDRAPTDDDEGLSDGRTVRTLSALAGDAIRLAKDAPPLARVQVMAKLLRMRHSLVGREFLAALRAAETVPDLESFVDFRTLGWCMATSEVVRPAERVPPATFVEDALATRHPRRREYLVRHAPLTGDPALLRRFAKLLDDPDTRVWEQVVGRLSEVMGRHRDLPNTFGLSEASIRETLAPFAVEARRRYLDPPER
ncbi:MAG: hypothetical protein KIS66_15105 [Fimbriimonadaceae bacterium]|nr:hypothetical protein [Fimbriimonadaceae bacterium]